MGETGAAHKRAATVKQHGNNRKTFTSNTFARSRIGASDGTQNEIAEGSRILLQWSD